MLSPNTILRERYRIVQQLGRGGMGAVYQAMDETLSCLVAVKETFAINDQQRSAFEREAKLLANLSHPALPRVMDHFTEGEDQFLVMQFIPGNDLAELLSLRERPFDTEKVLEWADYLLDALEELHSYNPPIIHRDIKPSNLKLTPRGRIILLDFGIAKGAAGQMTTVETDGSLGAYTPNYAPVEQAVRADPRWVEVLSISNEAAVNKILQKGTDPRSDLYALAATLYHLMTGLVPSDAPTRALSVWSGRPDRLSPANNVNPEVAAEVAGVLQKAMAIDRDERPAGAVEMRRMLREAASARPRKEAEESAGVHRRAPKAPEPTVPAEPDSARAESTKPAVLGQGPGPAEVPKTPLDKTIPARFEPARAPAFNRSPPQKLQHPLTSSLKLRGIKLALGFLLTAIFVAFVIFVVKPYIDTARNAGETTSSGDAANAGDASNPRSGFAYAATGDEGTILGTIRFAGVAPSVKQIDTAADAACTQKNPNLRTEDWLLESDRLANTLVYLKDGTLANGKKLDDYAWTTPASPVALDQDGCAFRPRVVGAMVNQNISITNSDPTTHNIHFMPKNNPTWNQQQASGAPAITHRLRYPEVVVPVKCNQHPWMRAYIGVLKHPFFAVSAGDGSFTIKGVPPGRYTVVAWHEGPGPGTEKTVEVNVTARELATANFAFGASAEMRGRSSSLKMLPAIEIPMLGKH